MNLPEFKPPAVKSSSVKGIGYDQENSLLYIEFNTGAIYEYKEVSAALYAQLMNSESAGSFVAKQVSPNHSFRKLDLEDKK